MTQATRDRLIEQRIAALGRVPSVRRMAGELGTDPRTVRRAYRRLGVRSAARPGRPAVGSNVVHVRLSNADYDRAYQLAAARDADITDVVSEAAAARIRAMTDGTNLCS